MEQQRIRAAAITEAVPEELPAVPEICAVIFVLRISSVSVWEEIFVHACKYKKNGVSGLLMAFAVVLIILSGILDFNTQFFLAAAAFLIGVIIREFDLRYGLAFFLGCLILGGLLAPQKLYCITYAMMGDLCAGCGISLAFPGESSRLEEPQTAADP